MSFAWLFSLCDLYEVVLEILGFLLIGKELDHHLLLLLRDHSRLVVEDRRLLLLHFLRRLRATLGLRNDQLGNIVQSSRWQLRQTNATFRGLTVGLVGDKRGEVGIEDRASA